MATALRFLFWSVVFGLAYAQAPLYYSNQNQYFLHGLARAGWGHLDRDWLANTADPTPVFSAMVEVSYRWFPEEIFHVYYLLIFGLYLWSMVELFKHLAGDAANPTTRLVFITLLTLIHSAALRWASAQLTGVDYPWYGQAGVAGQYVLGAMFQPSVFGVLLIASIAVFVRGRPILAIVLSSVAASICRSSCAISGRAPGCGASARATIASTAAGTGGRRAGRLAATAGGVAVTARPCSSSRSCGRRPVSSS